MKLYQYIGVLLCVVMGSKSETSDVFKGVVEPVIEKCRSKVEFTEDDYNSVINMEEPFSPAAKCLIECGMTELNMVRDGEPTFPEEYVVKYQEMYEDVPERMEHPYEDVLSCWNEVRNEDFENTCDVGVAMLECTRKEAFGENM